MRLIDADALKEKKVYCPERHEKVVPVAEIDWMPTVEQPHWISVEDKLPEVGKVVLAFGTRSATTGMFQGINNKNDHWWWKGHTIKHVSHWMPLPEPPEEEN